MARTVFVVRTVTVAAGLGVAVTVASAVAVAVTVAVTAGFAAAAVVVESLLPAAPMMQPMNHDPTMTGRMMRFRAHARCGDRGPRGGAGGIGGWPHCGCVGWFCQVMSPPKSDRWDDRSARVGECAPTCSVVTEL